MNISTNLFDEIHSLERAIKQRNPKARLNKKPLMALRLEAIYPEFPADVDKMSLFDLIDFVRQKRKFYGDQPSPLSESDKRDNKIREMYGANKSDKQIGHELGLGHDRIRQIRYDLDLKQGERKKKN